MDIITKALAEYKNNFKICLLFALLLAFVPAFIVPFFKVPFFETGITLSSGTLFVDYLASPQMMVILLLVLIFLAPYSLFVALISLAVRRDLSKVKVHFYLEEMIEKFALKIFTFYALVFLLTFFISLALSAISIYALLAFLAIVCIAMVFLMFVPQVVVVDELPVSIAMRESISFVRRNWKETIQVLVVGSALLLFVGLFEYLMDLFFLNVVAIDFLASEFIVGESIGIVITLVFIVPFIEILKTFCYMLKFDLIRKHELAK